MTIEIRPATAADAPALSRLGAATFRETFEGENSPEDMARYLADSFSPERQAAEIADPQGTVLLAEHHDGRNARRLCPPDRRARAGGRARRGAAGTEANLRRSRVAWPRGAQALMSAAVDAARARGAQTLWLGVWERNPRAVAFYAKYGFERVGEHAFVLGADRQTDWLFARPIGPVPD